MSATSSKAVEVGVVLQGGGALGAYECGALIALLETPELTVDELMRFIPGPDFPTAGFICGQGPIRDAYREGRGILTLRARAEVETDEKSGRSAIIVTEIPFQVNKARLIERVAENVHELWAQQRIKDGWSWGPKRDDAARQHPGLVPYSELSDAEKEYDRITTRGVLESILALGYRVEPPR